MSKSFRTRPPRFIPNENRVSIDNIIVFERKSLKRDHYPLNKKMIQAYIKDLPPEYMYGLKSIELRDRNSIPIGDPYAFYRESEKDIIMYSVPPEKWLFSQLKQGSIDRFKEHNAKVIKHINQIEVLWRKPIDVAYFMFREVFLHELGHHYVYQYRHRNKPPNTDYAHEELADIHMGKLSKKTIFYDIWMDHYKRPNKALSAGR